VLRETDGVTPLADAQAEPFFPRGKRRAACPLACVCGLQLNVWTVRPARSLRPHVSPTQPPLFPDVPVNWAGETLKEAASRRRP